MTQLTVNQLQRIMPSVSDATASKFCSYFNANAPVFGIDTRNRMAHFLGQIAVESGELSHVTENLSYSANRLLQVFPKYFRTASIANQYAYKPEKIGSRVYAGRMGNGDEASKDGYTYRGRGFIQITGKDNYRAYNTFLRNTGMDVDLIESPFLLSDYPGCLKSAMWYFKTHGCLTLADKNDIESVTRKINGGTNGLLQRKQYTNKALQVLA